MKTRYTITVPLARNDGTAVTDAEIHGIESDLLDWSEGFTSTDSVGAWRGSDGTIYHEPVRVYALDVPDTPYSASRAVSLADFIAIALDQEAVYMTRQPIHAAAVEPVRIPAQERS